MHNFYIPQRKYYFCQNVAEVKPTPYGADNVMKETTAEEANLIGSLCTSGKHAPVIDFDIPIEVYPSSRLGHYHLYINKETTWAKYRAVLKALKNAGFIEPGYADASIAKEISAVRPVGVVKPQAPKGVNVLKENAVLRKRNYELSNENQYLLERVKQLEDRLSDNASQVSNTSKDGSALS